METQFYAQLLDQISDGVYFVTRDRRITYWNGGAQRLTGYSADEVAGKSCADGILRHVDDAGRQMCLSGCPLSAVMRTGQPCEIHMFMHHKEGHRVPVTVRSQPMTDAAGEIIGSVEVFSNRSTSPFVGSRRRGEDDSLDPMTGLPIRRFGEPHLEMLLGNVQAEQAKLAVLFLDVDYFKSVNDTFGHSVGDRVLRMVGQSLANALRSGDVPVRWGGEEFLALLPGTDEIGAAAAAERVRMLVENSWIQLGEVQARVTVSIGATSAIAGESVDDLVTRADRLMYASKHAGRNRVTTDAGTLTSTAEAAIMGTASPWEAIDLRQSARA